MEHNIIELQEETSVKNLILYQKDNNLDKMDNLDALPTTPAVYAICGRVNGQPANCRFVSETDNLQERIKKHFTAAEPHECLKTFMQSIKTKVLVFEEISDSTTEERLIKKNEWELKHKPDCNEKLNEIH